MASNPQKVVVVIPTYNERENISRLIPVLADEIFPKVDEKKFNLHILIVDDSSPDKTAGEVRALQKKYKNLHLLVNKEKGGLGKAYTLGMQHALNKLGADIVFEFDADFSHDPKKIPEMLEKISGGADMVLGSRYIKGGSIPQDWGLHRKFLSILGNLTIRIIMTDFSIADWTTGYRALKREVVEKVLPQLTGDRFTGYTFQIGFLHKAVRAGFNIQEVPLKFIDRTVGKSKLGPEYIKNTLAYIIKVRLIELYKWRIFKFVIVGGTGALVQLISLQFWRQIAPFQLAFFLGIETAIFSNFILNNLWTFADAKLKPRQIPTKFLQFNLTSAGSILIQQAVAFIGERTIGLVPLFTVPVIQFTVDSGTMFAVVGILIGMFWNFFAYTKLIWRVKK